MEFEQITKRLEWLDDQERKSKASVSEIGKSLAALETTVNAISKQLKALTKEVSDLVPTAARLNQFDQILSKQRAELNKAFEDIEKNAQRRERETGKQHQLELKDINASIDELRAATNFEPFKKQLKDQSLEDKRLSLAIQDMQQKVEEALKQAELGLNISKESEETSRQNLKRISDMQAEMAAVRKHADEAREKTTLHSDGIRNLENRMTELMESEAGRKDAQTAFLDQQVLAQVERDHAWKDWQAKYEVFKKQAENMELQVAALDDTIRAAKRSQDAYNELNQKLERRIAEISEMQRLAEDRIRQEWVAFKADEQKRWTSHSLSQEEVMRDLRKDLDKIESNITQLNDASQTLQDQLHQTSSTTEQQLQELMNVSHEWLTAYERIMGHSKTKTTKKVAK
jgi:chromosome segregation ATPase